MLSLEPRPNTRTPDPEVMNNFGRGVLLHHNYVLSSGLSLKIEVEGRNKKVEGGSGGVAYS